jgi:hypothetical protein
MMARGSGIGQARSEFHPLRFHVAVRTPSRTGIDAEVLLPRRDRNCRRPIDAIDSRVSPASSPCDVSFAVRRLYAWWVKAASARAPPGEPAIYSSIPTFFVQPRSQRVVGLSIERCRRVIHSSSIEVYPAYGKVKAVTLYASRMLKYIDPAEKHLSE